MWVCRKVKKLLSAYYDGELGGRKLELVREHLDLCEDCRSELDKIRRLSGFLAARADVSGAQSKEWERRWETVRESLVKPHRRTTTFVRPMWTFQRPAWTTVAAAVVLVVVGVLAGSGVLPWSAEAMALPGTIVTLVESDVENSSAMYYYCPSTDLTVITLVPGGAPEKGR